MKNNMINVLFLTHYSGMGGASIALLTLINELSKFGIKSYVLLPRKGDIEKKLKENEILYDYVPFRAGVISKEYTYAWNFRLKQIKNTLWQVYTALKVKKYVKEWGIDIVHANSTYVLCGTLSGKLANIKTVWHLRENIEGYFKAQFFPVQLFIKWMFKKTDRIIAVSEYIERCYLGYDKQGKMIKIYDGTRIYSQKWNYKLHYPVRILYTGGLTIGKGIADINLLYNALKNKGIENYQIWMIDVTNEEIERYIKKQKWDTKILEKLKGVNGRSREELDRLRKDMDLFFMPSAYEALGLVTTEAMLIGLPIIGVDSGANKELLGNNERGYLYIQDDLGSLENQITDFLNDEKERIMRVEAAKEWAKQNVDSKKQAKDIYLEYISLLQK